MVYRVIDQLVKIEKTEVAAEVVPVAVPLVVFPALGLGLPLALGPKPDIVKVTGGESGMEPKGEPSELEEESECGLDGGIT